MQIDHSMDFILIAEGQAVIGRLGGPQPVAAGDAANNMESMKLAKSNLKCKSGELGSFI